MKYLQLMHISQNYFCQASSVTCPWDMTYSKMHHSINPHFSRTMQIMTNSIILHYGLHANLTNSEDSGGLAVLLKGILSDWMIGKQHLLSLSHNPSCGHHCPTSARQVVLLCNFHTRINFTSSELSERKYTSLLNIILNFRKQNTFGGKMTRRNSIITDSWILMFTFIYLK